MNFRANFGGNLGILGLEKLFGDFANFHPMDKEKLCGVFGNNFVGLRFQGFKGKEERGRRA